MSKNFSVAWKASKKPTKQRKYLRNSPLHIKQKIMKSSLSKDLRQRTEMRTLSPRKGDSVKVMRGTYKGKTGKIAKVQLKKMKIYIEGIERKKRDGTKTMSPIHASNLMIIDAISDKRRIKKTQTKNESLVKTNE